LNFLILFAVLAGAWQSPECKDCAEIKVTVTNFRSAKGEGFLALYSSKDGYPLDPAKALEKLKSPIENGQATFDLKYIKPGSYALIAMHDENRNGRMDRNLLGMPKEGYGASNNPNMPLFGPPSFESAEFKTVPGVTSMNIPLHYYPH
jgi:uncharacterized protein (DUF2141 family)